MRVAIVTAFPHDPAAPRGGVEAVSVNLTRALAEFDDLEIHVVTQDPQCTETKVCSWAGLTVHRLPRLKGSTLGNAVGAGRRQVQAYLRGLAPDLIHSHDVYGLMVKGLPIPRVFTVHGFIHGDTLVSGERLAWTRSKIWRRVEVAGWADQPHIISISPYVRERLTGLTKAVIHDIDNPISPAFFDIVRDERPGTIFSAALISPRKNTLALVEAVGHLAAEGIRAELRLAGEVVDEAYGEQVRALIARLHLEEQVVLLGRLSTAQVMEELSRASVFALVSLEENSPMGIEEAMAAGVPVVTSNRCGMPYMVRDGETGFLVDPTVPADIGQALRCLLQSEERRRSCGEKGRRVAEDRFHPAAVAARTRMVYLRTRNSEPQAEGVGTSR